ncbi:MAG: UDP-4-amino-4,6-dideoxy-N-acetyl-beta-L-altrosamine transaminase [Acidobacteria bacterium]|nr:UDP-4-amino-4,6-dideoxy-N-acetyl-beta-L-altrosamine transaminase [Acidobacteriota bacterium]
MSFLPYGKQYVHAEDIEAVVAVLQSDRLTSGPVVTQFEKAVAAYVGARNAVAVANGTAALHAAMHALRIGPGDEVIVPPMTFAATANCVVFQGGTPVFADVEPSTLLLDPERVEERISSRTKAIVAVDYAGQPCDYEALRTIADRHGIALVADACHSLGATYRGEKVGTLADLNVFSFHAVKHITTGEGGMVTTHDDTYAKRMRLFRNHGITADFQQREKGSSWYYEIIEMGYNYRLTDFQCALGMSQLRKLDDWLAKRRRIASLYDEQLAHRDIAQPLETHADALHAYHIYVVRLAGDNGTVDRTSVFAALRQDGIGVNVHYIPVHLHPFYRRMFGTGPGLCPVAEEAYERILTLPIFVTMTEVDVHKVFATLAAAVESCIVGRM